ncbi:MAG: hypothetical protein H6724_13865 [Sandaracinus sp.]|nr:hypothetical protein [Sandaracinus sp.]
MRALLFCLLVGCGSSTEPVPAAENDAGLSCSGGTPTCTLEVGNCCDDVGFSASCVDGAWVCDPCEVPEFEFACGRRESRLTGECELWARDAATMGISVAEHCGE